MRKILYFDQLKVFFKQPHTPIKDRMITNFINIKNKMLELVLQVE